MSRNLLAVGRSIGYENISQLQRLKKAVNSGRAEHLTAHFEMDGSQVDKFLPAVMSDKKTNQSALSKLIRTFFPKSTTEGAKTVVDVDFSRSGNDRNLGSSFLTVIGSTRLDHDIINSGELRAVKNQAGTLLNMSAKGESKTKSSIDMCITSDSEFLDEKAIKKSLDYTTVGATNGRLSLNLVRSGMFRFLSSRMEASTAMFNGLAEYISKGKYKTFNDFVKSLKG